MLQISQTLALVVIALFLSTSARAGGWISSGGEITTFESVPWILGYETEVTYCIVKDDETFPESVDAYDRLFQSAVKYWQSEMPTALSVYSEEVLRVRERIEGHVFRRETCSDDTVLRLQLGVLDQEQKDFLRTPQRYVAVAVRTELNEETLKAKGFIYVSPTEGDLGMDLGQGMPIPWDFGAGTALEKVLAHELGHVYGLRHQGQPEELMSSRFPESIITGHAGKYPVGRFPDFFRYRALLSTHRETYECAVDDLSGQLRLFFAIPHDTECISFGSFDPVSQISVPILGLRNGKWEQLGRISRKREEGGHVREFMGGAVFNLPPTQSLFPPLLFAQMSHDTIVGHYVPEDSLVSRDIVMTVRPGRLAIVGMFQGRIYHITVGS